MSIARATIDKPILTWILILGCLLGGLWGFLSVGRLEDPAFTIKQAVVVTIYPGASAEQVAIEVSEPLESEIQNLGEVDILSSINQPGRSIIDVEIKDTFGGDELPQIWDKLRNKVADTSLPEGALEPIVDDEFGDVFGIYYAIVAEGLTDAEIHDLSTFVRREVLAVEGVADVVLSGLPEETIYVEADPALYTAQNVSPLAFLDAIATANSVSDAGSVNQGAGTESIITYPEGSDSVADIAALDVGVEGEIIQISDIATVERRRVDDPSLMIRHDGQEAFVIGIAGIETENIIDVGERVMDKFLELEREIPWGVDLYPVYEQHVVVQESSTGFLENLAMSVSIVIVVLGLFMGWRAAVVVGGTLLCTIVGTLFFMAIFSIEMERISLGALIIAMGMLVDNAIVVAEGMQIAMLGGRSSRDSAEDVASRTQVPLLGATVIGIMAFAGIGLSPDSTGEFMFSLFAVIGLSLLLSWVLAITITPLLGHYFFVVSTTPQDNPYGGPIFRAYGAFLRGALRIRWLVLIALVGITAVCYAGFGQIKQQFFPDSNTPIMFVHYKLPQGTSIWETSADLAVVEEWLASRDDVVSTTTFVGEGADRFMLTYSSERSNPSYGHILVRTVELGQIPNLRAETEAFAHEAIPDGEFRTEQLAFGPGGGASIEARFSGSDPKVLRELGTQAMQVMRENSDKVLDLRTDWREQELVLEPLYAEERAQSAGVSRDDVADTLLFATDGIRGGTYRENERQIPIVVRVDPDSGVRLMDQVVYSDSGREFVPLEQAIDGLAVVSQDTLYQRRDRLPTLTVEADIPRGETAAAVHTEIRAAVEAIPLPLGYRMEWGGEFENSSDANESLGGQLPVSLLIMVLISVLLFNALRQPLIIWLLVPMSVNGVVIGLLGTNLPFTFTALLGLLSLSGMLIKNGIVLVEEIDLVRKEIADLNDAIITACTSRLRPVVLAATTTILGMIPLLSDAFFVSMAVTIMGGLAFASVLTLIAAPVFYRLLFRPDPAATGTSEVQDEPMVEAAPAAS